MAGPNRRPLLLFNQAIQIEFETPCQYSDLHGNLFGFDCCQHRSDNGSITFYFANVMSFRCINSHIGDTPFDPSKGAENLRNGRSPDMEIISLSELTSSFHNRSQWCILTMMMFFTQQCNPSSPTSPSPATTSKPPRTHAGN